MTLPRTTCPECEVDLQPIKLLDATHPGFSCEGVCHTSLAYAAVDAKPSLFHRKVPKEGIIAGGICPQCSRILLYGMKL